MIVDEAATAVRRLRRCGPATPANPHALSAAPISSARTSNRRISRWRWKVCRSVDPLLFSLQVFSNIMGGGMSSRLFQEVREIRGLCYSISSFHMAYSDTGFFGIYAGTDDNDAPELMQVVIDRARARRLEPITEEEVARAKAQMKASLLMALESSSARAEQIARQIMIYGRPLPLAGDRRQDRSGHGREHAGCRPCAACAQPAGRRGAWTGQRYRTRCRDRGKFLARGGVSKCEDWYFSTRLRESGNPVLDY